MAKDKTKPTEQAKEDPLTKRVDDMMDVRRPNPSAAATDSPAKPDKTPPLDIFKDAPTAPKLPPKLLKEIEEETNKDGGEKITVSRVAAKKPASTKQEASASPEPEPADKAADAVPEEAESAEINNPDTDKAVQDIVSNEGDEVLAVEDAQTKEANEPPASGRGWKAKLAGFFKNKWTWVSLAVVLVALFAVPVTRYKILGLFLKSPTEVTVLDSKTATPVSNAIVTIGGASAKTDGTGTAKFRAPLGSHKLTITKQYYQSYDSPYFVGFSSGPGYKVQLLATGRQVPVVVLNSITGKPVAGAELKVLDTNAKTNAQGKATIVLPTTKSTDQGTVSLNGYNTAKMTIQVTDKVVTGNTFQLTPAGEVYFLSDLSGKLDVVKTNLDGTGRKVILAGTGSEDKPNTSLLASRDWQYLVLESTRDDPKQPSLYLIDTSNDQVSKFESNSSSITLIGWSGHNFLYDAIKANSYQDAAGREMIKSYDADHQQTNLVDQNQVTQKGNGTYARQYFSYIYLLDDKIVYVAAWQDGSNIPGFEDTGNLSYKTDAIRSVQVNGQGKKDLQTFPSDYYPYYQATVYEPAGAYYHVSFSTPIKPDTYYKYEDGSLSSDDSLTQTTFYQPYPTFLQSPSGKQTFWTEFRDGKNSLLTGNADAENSKQIASLTDYTPYGWYSDNYLLVSKSSSELYVMPVGGGKPVKISDYYKPQQTFRGYGGGYGGL